MTSLTLPAYAKINLFLDITGRRADGYHTITGIMQSIGLHDDVTLTVETLPAGQGGIVLTCSHPDLPTDRRNLGFRAAEVYLAAAGLEPGTQSITIHIEKRIPFAAGMAGGSTDAAAVLSGLDRLYGHPLTPAQLSAVGLSLGADVPFCLAGGTQMTQGVGEVLTPVAPLPDCLLLVACGGEGVSTPGAYRTLDEMYGGFAPEAYAPHTQALQDLCRVLERGELSALGACAYNIFESAVLPSHSVAGNIKQAMQEGGALCAMMSGSGPSVFGVFADTARGAADAERARRRLEGQGISAWICTPAIRSAKAYEKKES